MSTLIKALLLLMCLSTKLSGQTNPTQLLIDKGIAAHDKGDYEGAVAYYHQALDLDSSSAKANYELANTCLAMKKYSQAIVYINKVINSENDFGDDAYTLKGTILDVMGNYDEAIQTYLEGIKKYPKYGLLQYNTAITYYEQKQYKDAAAHAAAAVALNRNHASSHLLLANCMWAQGKRVQSVLGLYYYLVLDNNSTRAAGAQQLLQQRLGNGVTKDGDDKINISISPEDTRDEFRMADLILSMSGALKYTEKYKDKTPGDLFYDQTKTLFEILAENDTAHHSANVWWDLYVPFFKSLNESGNTEAFCYYISLTDKGKGADKWLTDNDAALDKLAKWYDAYNK